MLSVFQMTIDIDLVMTCTVAKLNDAEDQLNKKNQQIIDLQQQLDMRENELNETLPKLEKEKCEREKQQLEKFTPDASLKKLEEDIIILENKNQEVVSEKKIIKERLDEISQSLNEEKKISKQLSEVNEMQKVKIFDLEELLLIECQVS
ncbi:myosin-9-like [Parasteatoda tepidariorum]|uniref:myosin-9-like n=1 Tax=Parasteatoda tepidariorum TaxID=114398 RepID=UPI001C7268B9|nr:myosin-9-like [Parasteatoda tepidariorum]